MNKIDMREWVAALEEVINNKLHKWKHENKIENGEAVRISYQFEQTAFIFYIFWEDGKEMVKLECSSPRTYHSYHWDGLTDKTFNKVMDRVGNIAQVVMHPAIDPMDNPSGLNG